MVDCGKSSAAAISESRRSLSSGSHGSIVPIRHGIRIGQRYTSSKLCSLATASSWCQFTYHATDITRRCLCSRIGWKGLKVPVRRSKLESSNPEYHRYFPSTGSSSLRSFLLVRYFLLSESSTTTSRSILWYRHLPLLLPDATSSY
jgi:hypothetical protein